MKRKEKKEVVEFTLTLIFPFQLYIYVFRFCFFLHLMHTKKRREILVNFFMCKQQYVGITSRVGKIVSAEAPRRFRG